MSGKKEADTKLVAERENALRRSCDLHARLSDAGAEHHRLADEFEDFRRNYGKLAKEYMTEEFSGCEQDMQQFAETARTMADLGKRAMATDTLPLAWDAIDGFNQTLEAFEKEANELIAGYSTGNLCTQMENVRSQIRRRMAVAERERSIQADLRGRLNALADAFESRTTVDPTMNRVQDAASEHLAGVRDRCAGEAPLQEADIEAAEQAFGQIIKEARKQNLNCRRQQHIADLLRDTFESVGFTKKADSQTAGANNTSNIQLVHEASDTELFVRISSTIPEDQSIHLLMEGAAGQEVDKLEPAQYCGDHLSGIIARARELGLIIEHVGMKGPDGLWRELPLEDEQKQRRLEEAKLAQDERIAMEHGSKP